MMEDEWRTTADVEAMLRGPLRHRETDHRFAERQHIFCWACVRRVWELLPENLRATPAQLPRSTDHTPWLSQEVFQAAFRDVADEWDQVSRGQTDWSDVPALAAVLARSRAFIAATLVTISSAEAVRNAAEAVAFASGLTVAPTPDEWRNPTNWVRELPAFIAERVAQAGLLRCVFGNPFRPVAFDPSWRTEAVVGLARGMDEANDFAALPVLADALEDAGCADADLLGHARGQGPHARGCHVVDHVLGKW